jgi:hypothetical protein
MFAACSGAPIVCGTNSGDFGDLAPSGAGAQEFGAGSASFFGTTANCAFTRSPGGVSAHFSGPGVVNAFADPAAAYAAARPPILGLDNKVGGFGHIYGLSYWNLDLSIKKNMFGFRVSF